MLLAYPALLKGNRLVWTEEAPPNVQNGGVRVYVIVLPADDEVASRGEQMAAALANLAKMGGVTAIQDPIAWQRELREDRPLYGRDEA
jgi:hypothetical protein